MSEHIPSHESDQEALSNAGKQELLKQPEVSAEKLKQAKHEHSKAAHEARTAVAELARSETQPNPLEKLQAAENTPQAASPRNVNRELRQITLRRELQQIRRKLPAPQRVLSRVIHQPVVRVVSEGVGKTVNRPSGLLGGGLVALVGTSGYLYLAKHLGFEYNYGVFLVLFAAGFLVGLGLEFLVYLAMASRRRADS